MRCLCVCAAALCAGLVFGAPASGAVIASGQYRLHNHPDGNARPPLYGLRLDELYNATANHDIFTFDFDHPSSLMLMDVTPTTVHIYGHVLGGRDAGNAHAADQYLGIYTVNFLYNVGVGLATPDDDILVTLPPGEYNYGTIQTPLGHTIGLRDGHNYGGNPNFRLGDGDNDLGHRGYPGISGWGWLFHNGRYVQSSDWLFTAVLVPTPGSIALMLAAGVLAGTRRRR